MKAFLSKMAAAVTRGQQQPSETQHPAASVQGSGQRSQSPLSTATQQTPTPNIMAMPQEFLQPLREVTMLTPVMVSRDDLSQIHEPVKHSFRLGSQLVPLPPLPALPDTLPGIILSMPLDGIDSYVKLKLPSAELPPDAELVAYLDSRIAEGGSVTGLTPSLARLEQTVKDSRLFAELSEEVKTSMITRLHRPRLAATDPQHRKYETPNELLLNESTRLMRDDNEEEASVKRWLQNRVRLARSKLNRRQLKQYEKEGRVLFRHQQGMHPRHIATELGVTATFINNALGALRSKGKQVLALDSEEVKEKRQHVRQ